MTKRRPVSGKQPSSAVKPLPGELPDSEMSQLDSEKKVRSGRGAVGRKDRVMPLLPLRGEVVYPNTIVPIVINRSRWYCFGGFGNANE